MDRNEGRREKCKEVRAKVRKRRRRRGKRKDREGNTVDIMETGDRWEEINFVRACVR